MIVHSFYPENRWYDAFVRFVELLGGQAVPGKPTTISVPGGRRLVLGWATGDQRFRAM